MDADALMKLAKMFENTYFVQHLGMHFLKVEPGFVVMELPFQESLIGNPVIPALHGGAISSLVDTVGGACIWSKLALEDRVATLDLRVDYLRPGRPESLLAQGRLVRLGNRVGISDLKAYHPRAEDRPVALARAVYNIRRHRDREED